MHAFRMRFLRKISSQNQYLWTMNIRQPALKFNQDCSRPKSTQNDSSELPLA